MMDEASGKEKKSRT